MHELMNGMVLFLIVVFQLPIDEIAHNLFMYKSALDWKRKKYPDEIQKLLVDASDHCLEPKLISFLDFDKEWNM